jgi:alpha-ribazole phosphatase
MGDSLVLTLIRHGLTTYNEEKRYLGWTDLPLSESGQRQVQLLASSISFQNPDLLITSDLTRCKGTAQILFPSMSVVEFTKLREFDFGDWEGMTYGQLKDIGLYRSWLDNPLEFTPPKGESFQHFNKRIVEAFFEMLDLAEQKQAQEITVVCHGGVIRQWLVNFSPLNRAFFDWRVPVNSRFKLKGTISDLRRGLTFTSLQEEPIMAKTDGQ